MRDRTKQPTLLTYLWALITKWWLPQWQGRDACIFEDVVHRTGQCEKFIFIYIVTQMKGLEIK